MKSRHRPLDDIDRLADQTTGPVILVNSEWNGLRRRNIEQRMLTECHRHREWLARFHGFFVVHLAVLARRDVQSNLVLVLQHDPVAADILDAGFRIARDD